MYSYFLNKYSYTKEDLATMYGEDFSNFLEMMKNKKLVDPKSEGKIYNMEKEIDTFMENMTYNNRRRRRG